MREAVVLIVDDDNELREAVGMLLRMVGYQVSTAGNGLEALERLRQEPVPSLVIMDLRMPLMSGWDLRARMLADEELARVPVILVSGTADLAEDSAALRASASLPKPFEPNRLLDRVRQFCG